jgi:hypothetical protein
MKSVINSDVAPKPCVGCGFCCKKAQCLLSVKIYGKADVCPALVWDEGKNRYWCKVCQIAGELGAKYKADLYIGEGCCCGLNTDRKNIPPPDNYVKIKTYSKEVQLILKHLALQFVSDDLLWLVINGVAEELKDPDFKKWALYFVKEQRSSRIESFMG